MTLTTGSASANRKVFTSQILAFGDASKPERCAVAYVVEIADIVKYHMLVK